MNTPLADAQTRPYLSERGKSYYGREDSRL
jgi:hypothetical protein